MLVEGKIILFRVRIYQIGQRYENVTGTCYTGGIQVEGKKSRCPASAGFQFRQYGTLACTCCTLNYTGHLGAPAPALTIHVPYVAGSRHKVIKNRFPACEDGWRITLALSEKRLESYSVEIHHSTRLKSRWS